MLKPIDTVAATVLTAILLLVSEVSGALAGISNSADEWQQFAVDCDNYSFAPSTFEKIEQDFKPALLYLWSGDDTRNHGVAFLVDTSPPYYLTARHVVEKAIGNPSQHITGLDKDRHQIKLHVVEQNEALDAALLGVEGSLPDGMQPFEVFLVKRTSAT